MSTPTVWKKDRPSPASVRPLATSIRNTKPVDGNLVATALEMLQTANDGLSAGMRAVPSTAGIAAQVQTAVASLAAGSSGPAPDCPQFECGTALPDGSFDPKPKWDTLNEREIFEIGVWLPEDVSNFSGFGIFIHLPSGEWIEAPHNPDWLTPTAGAAYRDSFAISGDELPRVPESWVFVCASANAAGTYNRDADGNPTGPSVTMMTVAPDGGITESNLSPGFRFDLAKATPGTLDTAAFASTIRPVALVTSNPALPSATYPPGSVAYNTLTQSLIKVNAAGNGWVAMVDGGKDIVARSITGGTLVVGAVSTTELFAGDILVGQGGGKPSRFKVVDTSGTMIAFIGADSNGYFNYFRDIRIGPNINSPNIYGSASGMAIKDASISVTGSGTHGTCAIDTGGLRVTYNLMHTSIDAAGILLSAGNNTTYTNLNSYSISLWNGPTCVHEISGSGEYASFASLRVGGTEVIDSSRALKNVTLPYHYHSQSDIANLTTDLANRALTTHDHNASYYQKSETYTRAEVDALLATVAIPYHVHSGTTEMVADHEHGFTTDGPS